MEITRDLAERILTLVDHGLVKGEGQPIPGKMCVEAVVCYAMGLPHGDNPTCVSLDLRTLKIRLNDSDWSSDQARAKGMRRLALAQLESEDVLDEKEFAARVAEMTIGKILPKALRAAASVNPQHAEALESAALRCEQEPNCESALKAKDAAFRASDVGSNDTASRIAADVAYGVAHASYGAAAYYDVDNAADAADVTCNSNDDDVLNFFAEEIVQILVTMKAPGCQWLGLAPCV